MTVKMAAPKSSFKAIIFDLDDTLVGSSVSYARCLERLTADFDLETYRNARSKVKDRIGNHTSKHHRLLYFKQLLEDTNKFSARQLLELNDRYERSLEDDIRDQWIQLGRDEFMTKLKGHKLAVITNETTRTQILKLRAIDPGSNWFDLVVTSEEVGEEKPSSKIFKELFQRLNVKPEDCLIVGDDIEADIKPAIQFGATAIWTKEFLSEEQISSQKKNLPSSNTCIDRLEQVLEIVL